MSAEDDPSVDRGAPTGLLVIQERDVGLFSMVWQVLRTLALLEECGSDRIPVAVWGEALAYFHPDGHEGRRSVWEYYFEPLVDGFGEDRVLDVLGPDAFALLESSRKQLERERGAKMFPRDLHLLPAETAADHANLAELVGRTAGLDWAWTESFSPTIDGRSSPAERELEHAQAGELLSRYVRPRAHIRSEAAALRKERLDGHHVIGVHVRGTDAWVDGLRASEIPFERYFDEIDRRMTTVGRSDCRVFLATDEQHVVERFEERLGDALVTHEAMRSPVGAPQAGRGPTGQALPGFIASDRDVARRNGHDAVVEFVLLGQSDLFVHNTSSLSDTVRLCVPESIRV